MCIYFYFPSLLAHCCEGSLFPPPFSGPHPQPLPTGWGSSRQKESPTYRGSSSRHTFTYTRKKTLFGGEPLPAPPLLTDSHPEAAVRRSQPSGGQPSSAYWQDPPHHNLVALTGYPRPSPPALRPSPACPQGRALTTPPQEPGAGRPSCLRSRVEAETAIVR